MLRIHLVLIKVLIGEWPEHNEYLKVFELAQETLTWSYNSLNMEYSLFISGDCTCYPYTPYSQWLNPSPWAAHWHSLSTCWAVIDVQEHLVDLCNHPHKIRLQLIFSFPDTNSMSSPEDSTSFLSLNMKDLTMILKLTISFLIAKVGS